jgi:hypothetical protein
VFDRQLSEQEIGVRQPRGTRDDGKVT